MNTTDHKPTISIGLPAYNEEANIKTLLEYLLAQEITKGELIEILVMSDGSTDQTVPLASSVPDPRIKVVTLNERKGKFAVENKIFTAAIGDILIIFDCDVLPKDIHVIDALIEPIIANPRVGLVGADTYPAEPITFFESVLALSHKLKVDLYRRINNGDNLYLCHGRGRAFQRELYAPIIWPEGFPEDAFSYMFCKEKGLEFAYAKNAVVLFRSPTNFKDHLKQDRRYLAGKRKMEERFGADVVTAAYHIPLMPIFVTLVKFMCISPVRTLYYCAMTVYLWFIIPSNKKYEASWDVAQSSKKIVN